MKKKYLIPKRLEAIIIALAITLVALTAIAIGQCAKFSQLEKINSNALETQLENKNNIIYAYNALLHRIWVDNPNYVEDVLVECDEWVSLDQLVDGDFKGAFELETKADSIAYDINWKKGN